MMFIDPNYNPLEDLPYNTEASYVRGITKDGCAIYMPVDSRDIDIKLAAQIQLQYILDVQDIGIYSPSPLEPLPA